MAASDHLSFYCDGDPSFIVDPAIFDPTAALGLLSAPTGPSTFPAPTASPHSQSGLSSDLTWSEPSESEATHPGPSRPRTALGPTEPARKRVRSKVELAPGQPPTARGNPRIRVFVACYQCRARKVRCDGAKPVCCNCEKRPNGADPCSYDKGPNRKGPDKGRRSRGATATAPAPAPDRAEKQPARPKPPARPASPQPESVSSPSESDAQSRINEEDPFVEGLPLDDDVAMLDLGEEMVWEHRDPMLFDANMYNNMLITDPQLSMTLPWESGQNVDQSGANETEDEPTDEFARPPSSRYARDSWWDALLGFYNQEFGSPEDRLAIVLSQQQRSSAMRLIVRDLRVMFHSSPCWISFIHIPRFFDTLFSPIRRHSMQPSFLLVSGWVDIGLAQAALLIANFEMQSHPRQTIERSNSSLLLLDSLVRLFGLSQLDASVKTKGSSPFVVTSGGGRTANPAATLGLITPGPRYDSYINAPATSHGHFPRSPTSAEDPYHFLRSLAHPSYTAGSTPATGLPRGCTCRSYSLGRLTTMWPEGMPEAEFLREEARRLVWASVMVVSNRTAYTCSTPASLRLGHSKLFVTEPETVRPSVLSPRPRSRRRGPVLTDARRPAPAVRAPAAGEALARAGAQVDPDDMWSLALRTMLLLEVCQRVREDPTLGAAERAHHGVQAWLEIDDIEARLARHTCDMDSSFGFQGREMLFLLRLLTSYDFQRFIPQITTTGRLFYRDKAMSWLRYITAVAKYINRAINDPRPKMAKDHRKSMLLFWYIANVKRAMSLWEADPELTAALTVACQFSEFVEHWMLLWPPGRVRFAWQDLRYKLIDACRTAELPPPATTLPRRPRRRDVSPPPGPGQLRGGGEMLSGPPASSSSSSTPASYAGGAAQPEWHAGMYRGSF
ncbi:uncharacterized protein BXZ73DRAFT_97734 [Epithele typhae]|uniref:uncharacterized protein n=1 Tax=Epithele typhae TaxID=378194 RepID=UPI0020079DBF|nr:uncharacterized protein BXZ73DRAFT_97734 [Epithele typhae]KAH9942321.1 hypothetical protein BXZ73DRAFT_97734 [Epithele typhae]